MITYKILTEYFWKFRSKNTLWEGHKAFFPDLFFYVYNKDPQLQKPRRTHTTGPKPPQLKTPTPKTQYKTQTTINEQK